MDCCICYEKTNILITECNHYICLHCLLKLNKEECPYCRKKFRKLPEKIRDIININNSKNKKDLNEVSFGGGGLGVFWDAPGSNYFNLTDKQKDLLEIIKGIDYSYWNYIRHDININNSTIYGEEFLNKQIILKKHK